MLQTTRPPASAVHQLVATVVTAAVLTGAGLALPLVVAPLLNDDAHPVPATTFFPPGDPLATLLMHTRVRPAKP